MLRKNVLQWDRNAELAGDRNSGKVAVRAEKPRLTLPLLLKPLLHYSVNAGCCFLCGFLCPLSLTSTWFCARHSRENNS